MAAAATLKALTLELGGKNALIACSDAAPDEVAEGVVRGMNFRYVTGQSCNSTSRVYLHDAIYERRSRDRQVRGGASRSACPPSATPRCPVSRARRSSTRR
jgi:betaine-aldehyde dehydrogenase